MSDDESNNPSEKSLLTRRRRRNRFPAPADLGLNPAIGGLNSFPQVNRLTNTASFITQSPVVSFEAMYISGD